MSAQSIHYDADCLGIVSSIASGLSYGGLGFHPEVPGFGRRDVTQLPPVCGLVFQTCGMKTAAAGMVQRSHGRSHVRSPWAAASARPAALRRGPVGVCPFRVQSGQGLTRPWLNTQVNSSRLVSILQSQYISLGKAKRIP